MGSLVAGNQTNSLIPRSGIPTFSPSRIRARVAQLDRASASGAEGCGFDPRPAHHFFFGFFPILSFFTEERQLSHKRRREAELRF